MKNKSLFSQVMLLIIVALICIALTVGIALFAGSYSTVIFDFKNFNFANMIPVLIIGGVLSSVVVGITVLFVSRSVCLKVKEYFTETKNKGDNER